MAEQDSHNVVDNFQSTSASAPVDVAANQTNIDSAGAGTHAHPLSDDCPLDTTLAKTENELATTAHSSTADGYAGIEEASIAAEPSAGEAAEPAAESPVPAPVEATDERGGAASGELENGVHDAASQGEGLADDRSTADISVSSDTDAGRGDGTEKKEGNHHVRTNSVKKPTTFSKVSVTKTFMAKTATPVQVTAKVGEKPSPLSATAVPVAKPRLVAKTGASQNMQKPSVGPQTAGGPDASRVWNKNRPVAPPPPKQFTDEELKQQYGIHLATRLQTDEGGKDSKWADIDDDEDDWAPEAVVWMDGTKSTLTPADVAPLQKPGEQKLQTPQSAKPADGIMPVLAAIKKSSEMGPQKTILKPGIATQQVKQQSGVAAASPVQEKLSLKPKSPAPVSGPAKSPWARLPPVEAVAPINPPIQPQAPPVALPPQDARAYAQPPPPPPPATREIAADTFDRSWHESEGAPRELFNSANGRYEPAPEGRRSSIKPDASLRKSSVLQRSTPSGAAPAEPSAAFQTRTSSQMDGASWSRRRGSSVSQGSLPPGRRLSVSTKGPDLSPAPERRQSTVIGHDMRASPISARNEPMRPALAQQSAWEQQMPSRPEPGAEPEDPVKVQERVMREKRELAVRRRKEEEERAEAEKQERLRAKLAALEGAGKSKKEREAETAAAAVPQTPATEVSNELASAAPTVEKAGPLPQRPAGISAESTTSAETQAPQPIPPPTQVQLPSPEEQLALPAPLPTKPQHGSLPERPISSVDQAQRQAPRAHLSPRTTARAPFGQQPSPYYAPTSAYSSPGDRKPQPLGRSPIISETLSGWSNQASGGSVWGTSGIGNGTFESSSSFAPVPMSQQGSSLPPPPGMTRPATSTRISPQAFGEEPRSPNLQQQQVAEQQRIFPPPGIDSRPELTWGQPRTNGASPAPGLGRQAHLPGPIAPPSRAAQQQQAPLSRADPLAAWNSAAQRLPYQYASDADAAAERKKSDVTSAPPREDTIKETFKQTSVDPAWLGGPRRFEKTEYVVHDVQGSRPVSTLSPAPTSAQAQPVAPGPVVSPAMDPRNQAGERTVRIPDGSLNPAHGGGLSMQQPPIRPSSTPPANEGNMHFLTGPPTQPNAMKEESPPPPETSSHPVNDGTFDRPNVKLPPPPPVVKLPPAPAHPPTQQSSAPVPQLRYQNWGPAAAARPIVANADWQARFNGLFNRTPISTEVPPSPPRTPPKAQGPALAVASSSKALLDEMALATSATVSLPQKTTFSSLEGFTVDESDDVVSKPSIEQMFHEELSFGSQPKVYVPRNPPYNPEVYSQAGANLLKMGTNSRFYKPVEAQCAPDLNNRAFFYKAPAGIFVNLPGTKLNHNTLVKHIPTVRKPSAIQERKPSGRANKSRGKDSAPASPVTNSTPNSASRSTSLQKTQTPPATASPGLNSNPANAENAKKQSRWARPPKARTQPVTAS